MASARERHVTRDPSPARSLPCTVPIHPVLPSRQSLPSARRAHLHPSHHLSSRPSGTIPILSSLVATGTHLVGESQIGRPFSPFR
eukprot:7307011-Prymnesium_polylepis.1